MLLLHPLSNWWSLRIMFNDKIPYCYCFTLLMLCLRVRVDTRDWSPNPEVQLQIKWTQISLAVWSTVWPNISSSKSAWMVVDLLWVDSFQYFNWYYRDQYKLWTKTFLIPDIVHSCDFSPTWSRVLRCCERDGDTKIRCLFYTRGKIWLNLKFSWHRIWTLNR